MQVDLCSRRISPEELEKLSKLTNALSELFAARSNYARTQQARLEIPTSSLLAGNAISPIHLPPIFTSAPVPPQPHSSLPTQKRFFWPSQKPMAHFSIRSAQVQTDSQNHPARLSELCSSCRCLLSSSPKKRVVEEKPYCNACGLQEMKKKQKSK